MTQNHASPLLGQGSDSPWFQRMSRREPISKFGALIEMLLVLATLVVFNLFPALVGMGSFPERSRYLPFLLPGLRALMPWLNVAFGLSLLLAMGKFAYGRWTIGLRWAELGVSCVNIYILIQLIAGGPIMAVNPQFVAEAGSSILVLQEQVVPMVNMVLKGVMGFALVITVITTAVRFALLLLRSVQETVSLA